MICSVVIAEIFHRRTYFAQVDKMYAGKWVRIKCGTNLDKADLFGVMPIEQLELAEYSFPHDEHKTVYRMLQKIDQSIHWERYPEEQRDLRAWNLSSEFSKVDSWFVGTTAMVAIFGSALWAYGHLIWSS